MRVSRSLNFVLAPRLLILVLASLLVSGCGVQFPQLGSSTKKVPAASETPQHILPVNVVRVRRESSYVAQQNYIGLIKPQRALDLGFSRAARIHKLFVDHGDIVDEGSALAELESQHLELQKQQLERALAAARLALAQMLAAPRPPDAQVLRQSVEALRADLEQLKQDVKAQQEATADLPNQTIVSRLQSMQRDIDTLDALTRGRVEAQQAVITDLEGQLAAVQAELDESTLRAPFDGIIAMRYASEAALVASGHPVVRLIELGKLEAWIAVPVHTAEELSAGSVYDVEVGGRQVPATLSSILTEVDPQTRARTAIFRIDSTASQQLSPGEVALLNLPHEVDEAGFWLPVAALTRQLRGLWSVYVVEKDDSVNSLATRRFVEVIHLEGERAWVRGMLEDEAMVVSDGTHRIVEGQRITVQSKLLDPQEDHPSSGQHAP